MPNVICCNTFCPNKEVGVLCGVKLKMYGVRHIYGIPKDHLGEWIPLKKVRTCTRIGNGGPIDGELVEDEEEEEDEKSPKLKLGPLSLEVC